MLIKVTRTVEVDTKSLPDAIYQEVLQLGIEAMLAKGTLMVDPRGRIELMPDYDKS